MATRWGLHNMFKILAFAVILLSQTAYAEVVELNRAGPTCDAELRACTLVVQINGEMADSTVNQLKAILETTRQYAEKNKYFFTFFQAELNSPGGNVDAALAVGRILRTEGAAAVVNRGAICLSACVLTLAGGSSRSLDGTIGIHRPYFSVPTGDISAPDVRASYQELLGKIRAYLRAMNVVDSLADAMLQINPENMHMLSAVELSQYGLSEIDPVAMETFDLEQAQKYGLDRQEYMRRKSLAEQQCGGAVSTACYQSVLKAGHFEQPDFTQYGRSR